MKRVIILIALLLLSYRVFSRIGCMDNSFHLNKSPDFKTYHYVNCDCPCEQNIILEDRAKCLRCQHYHNPKDLNFMPTTTKVKPIKEVKDFKVYFNSSTLIDEYLSKT